MVTTHLVMIFNQTIYDQSYFNGFGKMGAIYHARTY